MTTPRRIQRQRTRGWRLPAGAVIVSRPSRWGNPWTIADLMEEMAGHGDPPDADSARAAAVESYRAWLVGDLADCQHPGDPARRRAILEALPSLRGKSVACFCRIDQACHGDVLLSLANVEPEAAP